MQKIYKALNGIPFKQGREKAQYTAPVRSGFITESTRDEAAFH